MRDHFLLPMSSQLRSLDLRPLDKRKRLHVRRDARRERSIGISRARKTFFSRCYSNTCLRYIEAEQRLGRINARQDPLSIAALLLGPCFQYIFTRHFMGTNPIAVTDQQFVEGVVKTLLAGIAPAEG